MAQYVQIPKDLNKVKDKFLLGLTKRQTLFFGIGLALGIAVYYFASKKLDTSMSSVLVFFVASPFFIFGMFEKNGLTLDQMFANYIRFRFIYPQIRTYETENIFAGIEEQIQLDKELKMLETGKKPIKNKADKK